MQRLLGDLMVDSVIDVARDEGVDVSREKSLIKHADNVLGAHVCQGPASRSLRQSPARTAELLGLNSSSIAC